MAGVDRVRAPRYEGCSWKRALCAVRVFVVENWHCVELHTFERVGDLEAGSSVLAGKLKW